MGNARVIGIPIFIDADLREVINKIVFVNLQAKKAKLHQFLTTDIGYPKLREHLASVVTILKLSKDKEQFKQMLDAVHPKFNETFQFDFLIQPFRNRPIRAVFSQAPSPANPAIFKNNPLIR